MLLKGLTWDHPRGYAPLSACAPEYQRIQPEICIQWDRRTLREFGESPIERYLGQYDLLILDHPFVGFAAANNLLVNFAPLLSDGQKKGFAADSVGPSWQSYWYGNGLWALPIDAATQVACYRPDLLRELSPTIPKRFDEVLELGRKARALGKWIIVAGFPTDAISLFFTLTAGLGKPIPEETDQFADPSTAREVLVHLHELIATAHPKSLDLNPIQVYDLMIATNEALYCPYGFGYSNYSRTGSNPLLKFVDAPAIGTLGCSGAMLGGTGIAVSRQSHNVDAAVAYAKWLTSKEHQCGSYFEQGGQPASLTAWTSAPINAQCNDFFRGTLQTLQTAYVRPRFSGFVQFFEQAGIAINRCLRRELDDNALIHWLNTTYASFLHRAQFTQS